MAVIISRRSSYCPNFATAPKKLTQRLARTGLDSTEGALALVIEYAGTPIGDVALRLTDHAHGQAKIG